MSLDTWKAEFYKKPALLTTEREALSHSIRKWTGLLPKNLEKHGLTLVHGELIDKGPPIVKFWIDAGSCSLCHHHIDVPESTELCGACPLFKLLGARCDMDGQPYDLFFRHNDVATMLAALKASKKG